jgi:uncharacterized protein YciI
MDMSAEEGKIMQEHVGYWTALADKGTAVIFGAVADPKAPWGVAIVETDSEDAVRAITVADPTIKSGVGFRYDIYPMPRVILRK